MHVFRHFPLGFFYEMTSRPEKGGVNVIFIQATWHRHGCLRVFMGATKFHLQRDTHCLSIAFCIAVLFFKALTLLSLFVDWMVDQSSKLWKGHCNAEKPWIKCVCKCGLIYHLKLRQIFSDHMGANEQKLKCSDIISSFQHWSFNLGGFKV